MKKLLLGLLFFVAIATQAQTYTIANTLKLGTVNQGTAHDSVLVRGVDKIVKFVPRSEFGGGGGSQDLQSVLDNGDVASGTISLLQGGSGSRADLYGHGLYFNNGYIDQNFSIQSDGIRGYNDAENRINKLLFSKITDGFANFYFPDKPSGTYTLATTDDIPTASVSFQAAYNGGRNFSGSNRINYTGTGALDRYLSSWSPDTFKAQDVLFNQSVGLDPTGLSYLDTNIGGGNAIDFRKTSGGYNSYKFPEKTEGTYILATLDDIKIGTTAPASSTATGVTGEIRVVSGYIYWCIATNTWIRASGTTF
ncbi:hypothetical protein [Flavobacterium sp. IMCC34518]|uniref:hypothetical protein n=1 Tax=Flavobacterium sp. IMCC34518 TaxID=3003623 RepID=UPI0022AC58FE|nr:hypothetical protein [Flavobacterium sp. IMCC34518]